MRVDVLPVDVCADDDLVSRQAFLRELRRDLQRQLRRDLAGLEGLDNVIALPPARLADLPLGVYHLPVGETGVAVEVGSEDVILGFVAVYRVVDSGVKPRVPREYLCDGHMPLI